MIAEAKGQGLHLTADEVFDLSLDDAICTRAQNSISHPELEGHRTYRNFDWSKAKPYVVGEPSNLHADDQ
ncbi:hypothetical protein EOD10_11800 [Mesorhizobium sp. M7A.T.Ca.TU.009.01.3.2]|nr:hypothetical protein EOD10_11800 [Mesorhizobium sp. M7A.T.Ca.TU.009.01.3.2]